MDEPTDPQIPLLESVKKSYAKSLVVYFGGDSTQFYQFSKVVDLQFGYKNKTNSPIPYLNSIEDVKLLAEEGLLEDKVLLTDSPEGLVSGTCFGNIVEVPRFERELAQSVVNFLVPTDFKLVRLITCNDLDTCSKFSSVFAELAEKNSIVVESVFTTDLWVKKSKMETPESRISVVYGTKPMIQRAMFMGAEAESDSPDQFIIVADDCSLMLEKEEGCYGTCSKKIVEKLQGTICIQRTKGANAVWQKIHWDPYVNMNYLTDEEIENSGLNDWSLGNMNLDVPVVRDMSRWIRRTFKSSKVSYAESTFLADYPNIDLSDPYWFTTQMMNIGYDGFTVDYPQKPVPIQYHFLFGSIWPSFHTTTSEPKMLSNDVIETINWGHGHAKPNSHNVIALDTWFDSIGQIWFGSTFAVLLWVVGVCFMKDKAKFFLGVLSKPDACVVGVSGVVIALLSFISYIFGNSTDYISSNDSILNATLEASGYVMALRTFLILYILISIRDFFKVFQNKGLHIHGRVLVKKKLLFCISAMAIQFCCRMSLIHYKADQQASILQTLLICVQNIDKPIELSYIARKYIGWIDEDNPWFKVFDSCEILFQILMILYSICVMVGLMTNAAEALHRTKRQVVFKVLNSSYIIALFLLLLHFLFAAFFPPCSGVEGVEVINHDTLFVCKDFSIVLKIPSTVLILDVCLIWLLVIFTISGEMFFINYQDRTVRLRKRKLVPKHLFSKTSRQSNAVKRLDFQQNQLPSNILAAGILSELETNRDDDDDSCNSSGKPCYFLDSSKMKSSIANSVMGVEAFVAEFKNSSHQDRFAVMGALKGMIDQLRYDWVSQRHIVKRIASELNDKLERNDVLVVRAQRVSKAMNKNRSSISPRKSESENDDLGIIKDWMLPPVTEITDETGSDSSADTAVKANICGFFDGDSIDDSSIAAIRGDSNDVPPLPLNNNINNANTQPSQRSNSFSSGSHTPSASGLNSSTMSSGQQHLPVYMENVFGRKSNLVVRSRAWSSPVSQKDIDEKIPVSIINQQQQEELSSDADANVKLEEGSTIILDEDDCTSTTLGSAITSENQPHLPMSPGFKLPIEMISKIDEQKSCDKSNHQSPRLHSVRSLQLLHKQEREQENDDSTNVKKIEMGNGSSDLSSSPLGYGSQPKKLVESLLPPIHIVPSQKQEETSKTPKDGSEVSIITPLTPFQLNIGDNNKEANSD